MHQVSGARAVAGSISRLAESRMSPTVFREKGYRFFFFSREETRMHVHVVSADGEAKFWLEPQIALAKSYHLTSRQLSEIESILEAHRDELIGAWRRHFGG
jgi:hypothetical protein